MSIVLINIAVNQYDAALNIIISRFSRGIYFDGYIWKKNLYASSEGAFDLPSQLCTFLLCTNHNILYHTYKGRRMQLYSVLRRKFSSMFIVPISKRVCVVVNLEFEITFHCTIVDFVIIIYMYFCFVNEALF